MKLGLIGNPLGHSWSPQIHRILIKEDYQLWQLKEDELDDFFCRRDFDGINVTIPYKQTVMKYLDEIDPAAEETGAVNCIVNRGGILKGYNTDYSGLRDMLKGHGVNLQNGRTAILGSGGASKAAQTAVKALGGRYDVISRREIPGCISYEEMYRKQAEYTCLINATPVGMYPECDDVPADLNAFSSLHHVVDIIANPLRTRLQWEAKMKGIPAEQFLLKSQLLPEDLPARFRAQDQPALLLLQDAVAEPRVGVFIPTGDREKLIEIQPVVRKIPLLRPPEEPDPKLLLRVRRQRDAEHVFDAVRDRQPHRQRGLPAVDRLSGILRAVRSCHDHGRLCVEAGHRRRHALDRNDPVLHGQKIAVQRIEFDPERLFPGIVTHASDRWDRALHRRSAVLLMQQKRLLVRVQRGLPQ